MRKRDWSRLFLRRIADDDGVTMAELLVTMALTTVVMTLVAGALIQVATVTTSSTQSRDASGSASNIANEMSKVIRSASTNAISGSTDVEAAVVAGTASTVTLTSFVDTASTSPKPTRVQFAVSSSGQIVETRWAATSTGSPWLFATTASRTTIFPGTHAAAGSTPLFTYFDAAKNQVSPTSTGLTAAQRALITSVKFSLRIRGASGSGAVSIVNTVGMPNVQIAGATP